MARSPRWKRNQRLKCVCIGSYKFPHRKGGGACEHSPTSIYHRCRQQGMSEIDARIEQNWHGAGKVGDDSICPF